MTADGPSTGRAQEHGSLDPEPRLSQSDFAARYRANTPRLWCIAAAVIGDRSLADDALQEAALIALRKLDDFVPGTSFIAWMGQIVRNVSRNLLRQRLRRRLESDGVPLESLPQRSRAGERGPIAMTGDLLDDQDQFDDRLTKALGELPETARECLLLRTVLVLSHREIGRILDIPEGTAMSHVHRARAALRRRLATEPLHGADSIS